MTENCPDIPIKILATDLSTRVFDFARTGIYLLKKELLQLNLSC